MIVLKEVSTSCASGHVRARCSMMQTNWQSALPELVSLLQSHNVPTSLVLELMEVLPEECHWCVQRQRLHYSLLSI